MSSKLPAIVWSAALSMLIASNARAAGQTCLTAKEQEFAAQFSQVDQMLPHEFAVLMKQPADLLVLDVREDGEHAVGTLKGAIRVSPVIEFDALMRQIGSKVTGKTVIVFCSVGYRSSSLASRFRSALLERGVVRVANLRGGIFAWHNYGRPLVDDFGDTEHVHPYNRKWKSYLDFDHLARTSPRRSVAD
jgi:rhodanese-related sulfurtransferase